MSGLRAQLVQEVEWLQAVQGAVVGDAGRCPVLSPALHLSAAAGPRLFWMGVVVLKSDDRRRIMPDSVVVFFQQLARCARRTACI